MATIEIEGTRIQIDDKFLSLSPEEQDATVDEIARELGLGGGNQLPEASRDMPAGMQARPGPGMAPEQMQTDMAELSGMTQELGAARSTMDPEDYDRGLRARQEATKMLGGQPQMPVEYLGKDGSIADISRRGGTGQAIGDYVDQTIMGTPFIDEAYSATIGNVGRMMRDGVGPVEGYKREKALQDELNAKRMQRSPIASTLGRVTNAVATGSALTRGGLSLTRRLASGSSLPRRMGALAGDSAAISALYGAGEGNGLEERAINALYGAGTGLLIGGALPAATAGIAATGRGIKNAVLPWIGGATNAQREASRRVSSALSIDRANPSGGALSADDIAAALDNGQPIAVADMGSEATRGLARLSANASPEARATLERFASDRFASQSDRAIDAIRRTIGSNADDLALQDALRATARNVNEPAYQRAFASKAAQALYGPDLQRLMQAPAMQEAARQATTRGANRAAVEGFEAIRNPFNFDGGRVTLASTRDGRQTMPTLRFWDQTKRNIDSMLDVAKRQGDRTQVADLTAIKNQLVQTLDNAVPEYSAARQGAAQFFRTDNAVDAGKQFAKASKMMPEYQRGFLSMSLAEREAFRTGYASELIDTIKAAPDRVNVIRKVFGSPEAREKLTLAFGAKDAKQLEAFVRVENALDAFRGSFGNSTTARQLIDAGIMGGTGLGTWAYTGDWKSGIAAGLTVRGARFAGQRIDAKVMKYVADILLSENPEAIKRLAQNAAISPQHIAAVDALTRIASSGVSAGASRFTAEQFGGSR